jgi:hypothetical protein
VIKSWLIRLWKEKENYGLRGHPQVIIDEVKKKESPKSECLGSMATD